MRGAIGLQTDIRGTRVYTVEGSKIIGVEFALADGQFCPITLFYPDMRARSYQVISASYIDGLLDRQKRGLNGFALTVQYEE